MRALVTGSAGFIGRHMFRELRSRGYWVEGSDPDFAETGIPYYRNVMDLFRQDTTLFDLVVHCAYHVGGRAAIDGVNTNFAKNLQLDAAMFEWAVRTKQKRVLYFSSSAAYPVGLQDKTYAQPRGYRLKETDIDLGMLPPDYDLSAMPDSNYGWAKLTGERLAADARRNGLAVTVVRPFSGYGETQSLDYPFPAIVKRAQAGDLSVYGPRGQTRDWIHVSDVINGALAVVDSETTDPVNLCTGRGVEMGELAQMVAVSYEGHCSIPEPTYDESKPTGVFYRVGDPTRMLQYYEPKVTLEEGISRALRSPSATQG